MERFGFLSTAGISLTTLLCSLKRPLSLVFPWFPGRFVMFTIAMVAVLASGHRSALVIAVLIFTAASYYRGRLRDAVGMMIAGVAMIGVLTLAQGRLIELPFAVQRTLSWLPGEWHYSAAYNAQHSNDWRIEIWKVALTDPTYIENKVLGDGFGFNKWDLAVIGQAEASRRTGIATGLSSQEIALWTGNYHSGPITTLHIVGVVGSLLYYVLIFGVAVYAHRLIERSKGKRLFTTALYVCIPAVIAPFNFIVIYGEFGASFTYTLLSLGLLYVLERGLEMDTAAKPSSSVIRPLGYEPAQRSLPASRGSRSAIAIPSSTRELRIVDSTHR